MKLKFFQLIPTGDLKNNDQPHIIAVFAEVKADKRTIKTVHAWNLSSRYLSGKSVSPKAIDFAAGEVHPSDVAKVLVTRMSEGYYVGEHSVGYKTPAKATTNVLQQLCKELQVSYTACSEETAKKYYNALAEAKKAKELRKRKRELATIAKGKETNVNVEELINA